MPDNKKPPEPETQTDQSGNRKGSPPNQIDNVTYKVVGEESQISPPIFHPPKIIVPAGYKPFKSRTQQLPSGKDILIRLPDGRFVNQYEAERFYGTIPKDAIIIERTTEAPDNENTVEAIRQPDGSYKVPNIETSLRPQPKKESRLTTAQSPQIAQKTHVRTQPEIPLEPKSDSQIAHEKNLEKIAEMDRQVKQLRGGKAYEKEKQWIRKFNEEESLRYQRREEEKYGLVPEEKLSEIARMYGEFKKYYYQGFADVASKHYKQEKDKYGKLNTEAMAGYAQEEQLQAMQYGMHSLSDLHRGLDLASWNFFFKTLGPIGEILDEIHRTDIQSKMGWHGGRWAGSYRRLEYLISDLPGEKLTELFLDVGKKTAYLASRLTGTNIVSRVQQIDRFGRKVGKKHYVLTPFLKWHNTVYGWADFLEKASTEKTILDLHEELDRAIKLNPGNPNLHSEIFRRMKKEEYRFLPRNSKDLKARIFRALGAKNVAKRLKKTGKDPLSWLAILVGSWIFDLIAGNLARLASKLAWAVADKLGVSGSIEHFMKSTGEYFNGLRAGLGITKEFISAAPSLNTLAGGYLGSNFGGSIGQFIGQLFGNPELGFAIGNSIGLPVGGGLGWGYQWALNIAKNNFLMERAMQYYGGLGEPGAFTKLQWFERMSWQAYKDFGAGSNQFEYWQEQIKGLQPELQNLSRGFGAPGPMMRFANWLNSPFGRFFRPPIKGLAISQIFSPFEADILKVFPWYQGWMPPALQYLWEVKGAIWDVAFKPMVTRLWDFAKYNSMGEWSLRPMYEGKTLIFIEEVSPGLWSSNKAGIFIQDMTAYEGGGWRTVTVRPWYQQWIQFRQGMFTKLNNLIGPNGSVRLSIENYFLKHTTQKWFLDKTFNYFKNIRTVGLTNFAGFLIGFELAPFFGINPLIGGAVGWFTLNPVLSVAGSLFEKLGILPTGSGVIFVNLFSSGFWLGTGVQFFAGLLGYSLPWWFPLATGLGFGIAPTVLSGIAALTVGFAPAVGAFFWNLATAAAFGNELLAVSAVVGIATVGVMTIFIVFVVGSAFWVPLQEQLQGLQPSSPCFDISAPVIDGDANGQPIFKKDERKKICWTTLNKQDLYQNAINKVKTFDPPGSFEIQKYDVTINTPDGNKITWDNTGGERMPGYALNPRDSFTQENTSAGINPVINGKNFEILPPEDKDYKICASKQLDEIKNIYNNQNSANDISAEAVVGQVVNSANTNLVLSREVEFLNHLKTAKPQEVGSKKQQLIDGLKSANINAEIQRTFGSDYINADTSTGIALSCWNWQINQPTVGPSIAPPTKTCPDILKSLENLNKTALVGDLEKNLTAYEKLNTQEIDGRIKILNQQIKASQNTSYIDGYKKIISSVKALLPLPKEPSTQDVNRREEELKNLAKEQCKNLYPSPPRYFPEGSTTTICLDVIYRGEDDQAAVLNERDSADMPIWPLTTVYCQAELPTFINSGPRDKIQWPTDNSPQVSTAGNGGRGGGYRYNAANPGDQTNHTGIDVPGIFGQPVKAVTGGTVVAMQYESKGFGNYIIVRGTSGEHYLYGHLGNEVWGNKNAYAPNIRVGSQIKTGDALGYMGNSGNAEGVHLHFGLSSKSDVKSFWNNSNTTSNPCLYFAGGCPAP